MPSGYSFRPRAWSAVLAAAACAAGVALGNWQAGRADEKRAIAAQFEKAMRAAPIEVPTEKAPVETLAMKRVAATGRFVAEQTVFLDNKLRHGRPGYEVITPLRLDGLHVLVNRGWVAAGRRRDELPQVPTPVGDFRVEGLALPRLPQVLAAGEARGKVRQNLDVQNFGKETGLRLQPIVIEQHSPADDGLLREWARPDTGIEKHDSYALQWYSLAGLAVVLFVGLSFRRVAEG